MSPRIPPGNGSPVTFRVLDWNSFVQQSWGEYWTIPEYVYLMNNGRKFQSTDALTSGIYKKT